MVCWCKYVRSHFEFYTTRSEVTESPKEVVPVELKKKLTNDLVIGDEIEIGGDVAHIEEIDKSFGNSYIRLEFAVGEMSRRWGTFYVPEDEQISVID